MDMWHTTSFLTKLSVLFTTDCLEYDWAQIVSRGKRNEQGKLVFKVRYADETTGFADCSLMRGLHEMVTFMKSNEIKDEETPPASWLNERKKSKHCPEKSLMTVVEKETLFNIGTRVYAEYIDKQFGPSGESSVAHLRSYPCLFPKCPILIVMSCYRVLLGYHCRAVRRRKRQKGIHSQVYGW